jgi:hypothetical protein
MILVSVVTTLLTDGHSQPQRTKAREPVLIGVLLSIHRGMGGYHDLFCAHVQDMSYQVLWQRLLSCEQLSTLVAAM